MSATFSYAQAAKGAAGTPASNKTATEPEQPEVSQEEKTDDALESVTAPSESETPQEAEKTVSHADPDAEFTTVTSKHSRSKAAHSRTSSPSVRSTATQSKEGGDSSSVPNGTADASSDKQSQDVKADKSENGSEGSKEKSEKSEKSAPPKELKAAPLPSVNIWERRREAQEAKAKSTPAVPTNKTTPGKADETQQDSSKTTSKKKGADGSSEGTKDRKKTEGGKGRDEALPSVTDASLWPTPQVALGEEKKKAQEKTDKPERTEKSPVIRTHGKEKWMPVNYVPTAVFNTPLPSSGRGGRRAARGGRDGSRGGAHGAGAASGEKAASGQASQASAAKQGSGERGRNEPTTGRATSLPAQSRRSTSPDAANQEGRKAQAADRKARGAEDAAAAGGKQTNGGENVSRPQREGKQFTRNQEARAANSKAAHLAVDAQAATRANDRRAESGSKSADLSRDSAGFQEFNRERGDNQRGGRGSTRGRGPYTGFGQNPQFGTPQNNFVPSKYGFNDRQRSQHIQNGSQQGHRMTVRSPSLPASTGVYPGVYPFPADINTMYPYQAVAPGPMSAVPYQQYMEPFSLMTMLSMQLEYYFSVDNMCKDMFLRRHMDSQGFVPLGVIASFKRVKSLTEDFEMLRHVSRNLRNVEYQTGEDGVDRLRPKERWGQWILPVDQRDPSAQHEGAPPATHTGKTDENTPLNNNHADGTPNGSAHHGSRQFIPNGTASRQAPTSLSSTAPEFMPSVPSAQNEIANVGTPMDLSFVPGGSPELEEISPSPTSADQPFIDEYDSACRLDSPSMNPVPLGFGPSWCSPGFDVENRKHHPCHSATPLADESPPKHHSLFESNGPGPPRKKKTSNVQNKPDTFHLNPPHGRHQKSTPLDSGFVTGPPYRSWSRYLIRNFDMPLYNEFRRLALDDLLTRHLDYGFNALMGFYQICLFSHCSFPPQVFADMVGLSRTSDFIYHDALFSLLCSAMGSGLMEKSNRHNAGFYFNREYGKKRRCWKRII